MAELKIWNDPSLPVLVEFAPGAMEQIRREAVDGLLSLPRVGMGVGGLLAGTYERERIAVLDCLPIECAHRFGPSFRLTNEEAGNAASLRPGEGMRVVGCYCSKTRGAEDSREEETKLFDNLCAESWQVMLVVVPSTRDVSTGAVHSRAGNGMVRAGTRLPIEPTHVEAPDDLQPDDMEEIAAEPPPAAVEKASSTPVAAQPKVPAFVPEFVPAFASRVPPAAPSQPAPSQLWRWWAAAALLVALLGLAGFLTRARWLEHPVLDLRSHDANGHMTIEWNRMAVRHIGSGSLTVRDGMASRTILLNAAQLHAGAWQFDRQANEVTAILRAGRSEESTTFKVLPAGY
ncbi:MAG TPA: hypothetical protein VFC21_09435 [Bryobacteraceae bacterium]|nr:hypothetical protein [Bryobacteraceae bacterium]